jgi:hypothetical protein
VVQCKDWGGPVGLKAIQEVAFARTHYQAQLAAVVARNGYSKAAKGAAKTAGVYVLGLEDLRRGTSILDRSVESARLREAEREAEARAVQAEDERHASEIWHQFDRATERRESIRPRLICTGAATVMFTVSSSIALLPLVPQLDNNTVGMGLVTVGVLLMAGIVLLISALLWRPPNEPTVPRRSALRDCPVCKLRLRLDVGRSGWLTCPRCKWRFHAET